MKKIETSFVDNKLLIQNLPLDNLRKFKKFKLYLNSNKNIDYKILDNLLEIVYIENDINLIFRDIDKILSYVEKVFLMSVSKTEQLEKNIFNANKNKSDFFRQREKLLRLKGGTISSSKEFKEYVDFSDQSLACKLRPYQYQASYYLSISNGGFDFSVPGSGKTIITYASYNYMKKNKAIQHILIIGPINSYNAWYDEYYTSFGKKPNFINLSNLSTNDARVYLLSSASFHKEITFINIDKAIILKKEIKKFLENKKTLLVIDEAHKEKNPEARITKTVLEITKLVSARIILTGTPMPNGYEDLYTLTKIYSFYNKILPYSFNELKKISKKGASETQQNDIIKSIKPFYSRVSKKFLLETGEILPAKFKIIDSELSNEQREIYKFIDGYIDDITDDFESTINFNLIKAITIRKMQVSANPGLLLQSIVNSIDEMKKEYIDQFDAENSNIDELIKIDTKLKNKMSNSSIIKIVNKFNSGQLVSPKNQIAVELAIKIIQGGHKKVIIWDIWVKNMETIYNLLKKKTNYKIEIINGTVVGEKRQEALRNFKEKDSKILIANPATLAESISLHKVCQDAIYVNRNYNAAQFIQSKDRIHRINMPKNKTANYYFIMNENSIDVAVHERLDCKEKRMLKILDSDKVQIGGMDNEGLSSYSKADIIASFRK